MGQATELRTGRWLNTTEKLSLTCQWPWGRPSVCTPGHALLSQNGTSGIRSSIASCHICLSGWEPQKPWSNLLSTKRPWGHPLPINHFFLLSLLLSGHLWSRQYPAWLESLFGGSPIEEKAKVLGPSLGSGGCAGS